MSNKEMDVVRKGASSKEIRQARLKSLVRRLVIWVVVPTLLGIIYYGLIAAPQFDSVALIRVESSGATNTKASQAESLLVKEYAQSRAMLELLTKHSKFTEHYKGGGDFLTRLSSGASSDDAYEYFRDRVTIDFDPKSRTIRIAARAFSGVAAQAFTEAIITASGTMVNATTEKGREEGLAMAKERVSAAELKLSESQLVLSTLVASETPNEQQLPASAIAHLEMVKYKRDLARENYEQALANQVKLAEDVVKEQRYIAVISPPSAPSGSSHPRRLWGILTVFVLSFVLMGVFSMLGAALKEHARF